MLATLYKVACLLLFVLCTPIAFPAIVIHLVLPTVTQVGAFALVLAVAVALVNSISQFKSTARSSLIAPTFLAVTSAALAYLFRDSFS